MSVYYNENFKMEVVRAYMTGEKYIAAIAAEYNISKTTVREWANKMVNNANIKIPLLKSQKMILHRK